MTTRNKTLSILLMPAGFIVWFIGWSLYTVGFLKHENTQKAKSKRQTGLTFIVPSWEKSISESP